MSEADVLKLLYKAMDDFNTQYDGRYQLVKSKETVLFGPKGALDSLGLVSYIVSVEEKLEEALKQPMLLANARAVSQHNSPFRTVGTLCGYILNLN